MPDQPENTSPNTSAKPGLLQMTWSVVAAFCGIQSDANLNRDDNHIERNGFLPYIVVGVAMTLVFILAVYGVVQLILKATS